MYATLISSYEYSVTLNSIPTKINVNIHLHDDTNDICPIETKELSPLSLPNYPHPDDELPTEYHKPVLNIQPRKVYSRKLQEIILF
jgi:hypothetical protein